MIDYRIATESDYARINDFHNAIYKTNRTLDQFYWEFHHAPAGKSIYIIACDGDTVVGTQCAIPIRLVTATGRSIHSGKSEDTLVDPGYRGKNISNQMYEILFDECRKNGIEIIWGFTSATKVLSKIGFDCPFIHQQVLAVNDTLKSYRFLASLNPKNSVREKVNIAGLSVLSKGRLAFASRKKVSSHWRLENESLLDPGTLQSSILQAESHACIIDHSPVYMKWRIYDNPNYSAIYTFSLWSQTDELMAVVYLNAHANKVFYIIESLFSPKLPVDDRVAFLHQVTRKLFANGAILIRNWVFDHTQYNKNEKLDYIRAGYYPINRGISLVWKQLTGENTYSADFLLSRMATQGDI